MENHKPTFSKEATPLELIRLENRRKVIKERYLQEFMSGGYLLACNIEGGRPFELGKIEKINEDRQISVILEEYDPKTKTRSPGRIMTLEPADIRPIFPQRRPAW